MEVIRCSVVDKKRVEDPYKLKDLHEELTTLTKGLAEIKSKDQNSKQTKTFYILAYFDARRKPLDKGTLLY